MRGIVGINGYDTTLDVSDSSESDSEENLVLSNGERNKSPTNSQRTSSSCELRCQPHALLLKSRRGG